MLSNVSGIVVGHFCIDLAINVSGIVVGHFCMDLAIKKAKEAGIGWVVCKGNHNVLIQYCLRMQSQVNVVYSLTDICTHTWPDATQLCWKP